MTSRIDGLIQRVQQFMQDHRYAEAEPVARAALAQAQAQYGEAHVTTATCLYNLGEILREQGRCAEAAVPWATALAIRTTLLGDEHPDTEASCDRSR